MNDNIVSVIDIGSTKVCCCIANLLQSGGFEIMGAGYCVCLGVRSGIIVDLESVEKSVAKAVEQAEKSADFRVKNVYVSVSGKSVESKIESMSLNVGGRIIKNEDILRLFDYCNRDDEGEVAVIHSIPILYRADSLNGIKNPIGMIAENLSVKMNLVTVPKVQLNNLLMCLARCHLDPIGIVASAYASGLCFGDEDEDTSGSRIVIDFGGGTTSAGFFYNGVFSGMAVIPFGGKNISDDVAYGLNISFANAERLKTLHGAAFVSIHDESDTVFAPVIEDDDVITLRHVPKSSLNQIIQPRIEEILLMIKKKIDEFSPGDEFSRDVIITGGGSMLTGMRDFVSGILNRKTRIKKMEDFIDGSDIQIGNNFAAAVGMIKFAQMNNNYLSKVKKSANGLRSGGFFKKTLAWIESNL
ncbi:MAG: cell division protein FtsA [Holosporaceae bacterium]|jgi:cell division protein FtsA|nr:cell division protein FtsA [Holosporaceae bacterium]